MATIYASRFNLDTQLKALGFIPQNSNKEKEDVYQATHLGSRYERHITVYIHYDAPIFLNESLCTSMSVYADDNLIYSGMRPFTAEQFYYIFSSILPNEEYIQKLQNALREYEYLPDNE